MRDSKPMLFRKYHIISIIVSIIISIIMMPTVMASEKAGWAEIPANCGAARLLKHLLLMMMVMLMRIMETMVVVVRVI